jgi:integrase
MPDGRWRAVLSCGVEWVADEKEPGKLKQKRNRIKLYGATKAEVLSRLRAAQAERREPSPHKKLTLSEWSVLWLAGKARATEYKTHLRYEQVMRTRLLPRLGEKLVEKIGTEDVVSLYQDLAAAGVSQSEQRRAGAYLSAAMRDAVKRGLARVNPVANVPRPKPARKEFASWSREEARAFLAACKGHKAEPYYRLALDSGCRQQELNGLHWPEVDLDAGTIRVVQTVEEIPGTGHRLKGVKTPKGRRTVVLSESTVAALRRHREAQRKARRNVLAGPVFTDTGGGFLRVTNVYHHWWTPLLKKSGVKKVRPGDTRHTCATLLLLAGVPIKVVSERLGHASIQITLDHYTHVLPGQQEQAAKQIGDILG